MDLWSEDTVLIDGVSSCLATVRGQQRTLAGTEASHIGAVRWRCLLWCGGRCGHGLEAMQSRQTGRQTGRCSIGSRQQRDGLTSEQRQSNEEIHATYKSKLRCPIKRRAAGIGAAANRARGGSSQGGDGCRRDEESLSLAACSVRRVKGSHGGGPGGGEGGGG